MKCTIALVSLASLLMLAGAARSQGTTWYVSAARGKGKEGTKDKPARDLGVLASSLKAGDTVLIAGGTYLGRNDSGRDLIEVPVTISGGWNEDFTARDPWGATRTVLSGDNKSKNFEGKARLEINCRKYKVKGGKPEPVVVDGVIVDNGARNSYVADKGLKIVRMANPATGANCTPDAPGIAMDLAIDGSGTIQNCVVTNTAPTGLQGAIYAFGNKGSNVTIRNNLVVNNTGSGINCLSSWHPKDGKDVPNFTVADNTVMLCWKFDPIATHGGSSLKMDGDTVVTAKGNVFALNDYHCVDNARKCQKLTLADNFFCGALISDYLEFNTKIDLKNLEESAELLAKGSTGNESGTVEFQVDKTWAGAYAARNVIDRAKEEQKIKPKANWANEVRKMFGLPLDGGTMAADSDVWLHRIALEDVLKNGEQRVNGKFGCSKPGASDVPSTPGK